MRLRPELHETWTETEKWSGDLNIPAVE